MKGGALGASLSFLPSCLQKAAFHVAKGYLSRCKRLPFMLQKVTFHIVKGYLSCCKRLPFLMEKAIFSYFVDCKSKKIPTFANVKKWYYGWQSYTF